MEENITVVLKIDMHCSCEGCADRIMECIRNLNGVQSVKIEDGDGIKFTVVSKVDPEKLREKVEKRLKKKVSLISVKPNQIENKDKEKKDKKSTEPKTISVKVKLNCDRCIQAIVKIATKTKGFQEISLDNQNDLVMVRGTMDVKALVEALTRKLKTSVEIAAPTNECCRQERGSVNVIGVGDSGGGGGGCVEGNGWIGYGPNVCSNRHPYGPYFDHSINEMFGQCSVI
ncbi:unnamed protein product [Ilex paraguariensis]|uniref:HMA domain-containing protein n=1 Tax=Ilex paraguariensis TaxID=185542 RepID=A0ABC8V1L8_9AQUA